MLKGGVEGGGLIKAVGEGRPSSNMLQQSKEALLGSRVGAAAVPSCPPHPPSPPRPLPCHPHNARHFLIFEGADSCLTVWLNGSFLGASKDSRLPAEFEVTGRLREGGNLLAVQVGA